MSFFIPTKKSHKNYKKEEGSWTCKTCGSIIKEAWIHHPMWDKRFTCAGYGEVAIERVPFCPKCEEKPSSQGFPIYYQDLEKWHEECKNV